MVVVVPQPEAGIHIDLTNTQALPQTGLLGAVVAGVVDATIDNVQAHRGEAAIGPALSTSLLVKVRYVRSNIVVKEATYRGSDTSADLFRTQAQIQWEFASAMRQILRQVRTDLTEVARMQAAGLSN